MDLTNVNTNSSDELMRAQSELTAHALNHISSMSLKCAVELGIPDAIHRHGKPIALPDLLSALSISPARAPHLRRLMRMLTHSGLFGQSIDHNGDDQHVYSLTPLSSILVNNSDTPSLTGFVLAMLHPVLMNPFQSMSAWFKGDEGATPFAVHYGCQIWDYYTANDPQLSKVFNDGMVSDTKFLMDVLLKDCRHVFDGIDSLVDVGGGTGFAALAISHAFPQIKCSVLELPQVVNTARSDHNEAIDFIAGDMFDYIPHADAVLLKWVLHDWNDEECVKILKRCKEAISCKKDGAGKIIIIDQVMGSDDNHCPISTASQLFFDMMMMTLCDGAEREEQEWSKIFVEAGFKRYKLTHALGLRSVIEVYP